MGLTKAVELHDPASCINRAKDDEPVFVLLARDVCAPFALDVWIGQRIVTGKNKPDDPQILEAQLIAAQMRYWQSRHPR